ncbi:RHS repeat-associated core domain-containing protein [Flavobacterium sp. JP2137]|uniref:RHS repeat-associated core domain-containing protein n=1 Tax=Flavobacterium sp. JP2137 TaxID=3414510 RepID=UPI003D2FE955
MKELDKEMGMYYYGARYYDPKTSIFVSVDPLAEQFPGWTPYHYVHNNPINLIDPTGMSAEESDGWIKDNVTGAISNDTNATGQSSTPKGSTYLCEECSFSDLSFQTFNSSEYLKGDNLNGDGSRNSTTQMGEIFISAKNSTDLSTVGKNLLGLTYPGGNNPRTNEGAFSYSYVPSNLSEFPAIGHDRRYDNLGIEGLKGLLTDPRAIGADWRFVREELAIAVLAPDPKTKIYAGTLGIGLGLLASSKNQRALFSKNGLRNIKYWYDISNVGVSNKPSKNQ